MEFSKDNLCCRICLIESLHGQSIFDDFQGEKLPPIVQNISGVKIIKDEGFTEWICHECADILVKAENFRRMCLQSDAVLRSQIIETIDRPPDGESQDGIIIWTEYQDEKQTEDYTDAIEDQNQDEENQQAEMENEDDSKSEEHSVDEDYEDQTSENLRCLVCSKEFKCQLSFDSHVKYHRKQKSRCPICRREFAHKSNLKRHIATHRNQSPLSCEQCNDTFTDTSSLYEHLKSHGKTPADDEYIHKCELCAQQTTSLALHRAHMKTEHGIDSRTPFKCRICCMKFASKQGMFRHIDNIHDDNRRNLRNRDKNFLCNTCGKKFHTNFHLQVHVRVHTGERPFKCEQCSKSFSQFSGLKMHRFTHTGERPFSCRICGKTFNQYGHVREHLLTHSDERPHVCKICGHSFRVKGNLTAHMMIHTGTKPHVCNMCGKSYAQNTKLKAHIAKNHREMNEEH